MSQLNTDSVRLHFNKYSLLLGSTLVVFVSGILLIASLSFALRIAINFYDILLAFLIAILFSGWGVHKYFLANRIFHFSILSACLLLIVLGSFRISEEFYDLSPEGYQYRGFYLLQDGWNPWHDSFLSSEDISVVGYTKGPWINAAAVYKLTGHIDQIKGFNLLLMAAAWLISLASLLSFKRLSVWLAIFLASVFALNPVIVAQLFTFYVDGQFACLITILVCLVWKLADGFDPFVLLIAALTIIVTLNVKLSAVAVVAMIVAAEMVWLFIRRIAFWRMTTFGLGFASVVGVLCVGYNPYITNISTYGNPLYPATQWSFLYGSSNLPENFASKNTVYKLILSTFSISDGRAKVASRLKLPFTFSSDEILVFRGPDTRIGGFGPLFGGAMLLAGVVVLGRVLTTPKPWLGEDQIILLGLVAVTASVLIVPEAWWARYVPQFWLVPALVALLGLGAGNKFSKSISLLLGIVLAVNCILVMAPSVWHRYQMTTKARDQLTELAAVSSAQPVEVVFDSIADELRFNEHGIVYIVVNDPTCAQPVAVLNKTQVCLPAAPR